MNGRFRQIAGSVSAESSVLDSATVVSVIVSLFELTRRLRLRWAAEEAAQLALQLDAREQDAVGAALTAQADVSPETHDLPAVLTTGVRLTQPKDVGLAKLD
jgi:hypothetical protein